MKNRKRKQPQKAMMMMRGCLIFNGKLLLLLIVVFPCDFSILLCGIIFIIIVSLSVEQCIWIQFLKVFNDVLKLMNILLLTFFFLYLKKPLRDHFDRVKSDCAQIHRQG